MDIYSLEKDFHSPCITESILNIIGNEAWLKGQYDVTIYGTKEILSHVLYWDKLRMKVTPPEKFQNVYHFTYIINNGIGIKIRYDDTLSNDELRVDAKLGVEIKP